MSKWKKLASHVKESGVSEECGDLEESETGVLVTDAVQGNQHKLGLLNSFSGAASLADQRNQEAMALLLRGMPLPTTFGFPDTDGSLLSNAMQFCQNNHPFFSIFLAHPLHPFTRVERAIVWSCTFIWNFFINVLLETSSVNRLPPAQAILIRYTMVFSYAILIRQLVICPCYLAQMLKHRSALFGDEGAEASRDSAIAAKLYDKRKKCGEWILITIYVVHVIYLIVGIFIATGDGVKAVRRILVSTILTEMFSIVIWFFKFAPLFLLLFPIHRRIWYHGGTIGRNLVDLVLMRPGEDTEDCLHKTIGGPCVMPVVDGTGSWRQHGASFDVGKMFHSVSNAEL